MHVVCEIFPKVSCMGRESPAKQPETEKLTPSSYSQSPEKLGGGGVPSSGYNNQICFEGNFYLASP